ncbi:MAG TPA: hypothetical protein VGH95_00790 [Candidatus Aquirickettsiella sp.]
MPRKQISLLNRWTHLFGPSYIIGLLADREFANGELFAWCNQYTILQS